MSDKTFPYWLAVEESKTVRFSDLAHMMAKAMHPGEHELDSYAAARINLECELEQAVKDGVLAPRNPAGLGRHQFPLGDALQRAVFIPRQDLEPFLNERGIELRLTPHGSGPDYWTLENAANALQEQLNWHGGARAEFQDQMEAAAATGGLVVLDPHTCLPTRSEHVRTYYELVTPTSVNAWLESLEAPYRWSPVLVESATPRTSRRDSKPWEALLPLYEPLSGLYMMVQAAHEIANAEGFSDEAWMELEADMRQAIRDEKLPVRSRHTGRVKVPDPSDFLLLVTVADVNKWLEQSDVPYRWKLQDLASEAQPAPSTAQSSGNAPEKNPPPIATGNVAHAFDGLRRWDEKAWKDNLGSPPKWLEACIVLRGQRGVREHHWNPVLIGAALVRDGHAKQNNIRARFQTRPQLKDWQETWKTYEADNFDT